MAVNVRVRLNPERKRMAKSTQKLLLRIGTSDAKLYQRGKTFLPIFPTDDSALTTALGVVLLALNNALTA